MKITQRELKFRAWDKVKKKWAFKDFNFLGEISLFDYLRNGYLDQSEACYLKIIGSVHENQELL